MLPASGRESAVAFAKTSHGRQTDAVLFVRGTAVLYATVAFLVTPPGCETPFEITIFPRGPIGEEAVGDDARLFPHTMLAFLLV
jgi:hypothetical protein